MVYLGRAEANTSRPSPAFPSRPSPAFPSPAFPPEFLAAPGGFSVHKIDWSPHSCFPLDSLFPNGVTGPSLTAMLLRSISMDSSNRLSMLG